MKTIQVVAKPIGALRGILFASFFTVVLILQAIMLVMNQSDLYELSFMQRSWDNPLTEQSINIPDRWEASKKISKDGIDYVEFFDIYSSAYLVMIREERHGIEIKEYIHALNDVVYQDIELLKKDNHPNAMQPFIAIYTGSDEPWKTWTGSDIKLKDGVNIEFEVRVVQWGQYFWRLVSVTPNSNPDAQDSVEYLVNKVLKTIPGSFYQNYTDDWVIDFIE